MMLAPVRTATITLLAAGALALTAPAPAAALNPLGAVCGVAGWVSGVVGKACNLASHGKRLLQAGGKILSGHLGSGVKTLVGDTAKTAAVATGAVAALAVLGRSVMGAAAAAMRGTTQFLLRTTSPHLEAPWFSATYWQVAAIAALLTLPFLFACAIQAVIRSDPSLLAQAVFAYLPLAMLAVAVAAPLTMLMLAATDELCAIVSRAAGGAAVAALRHSTNAAGTITQALGSPFLALLIGLLTAAAALVLWLELLLRDAAVYVVVLMLPVVFAALVWPARRIWALRLVELLSALILCKFVIVAVLSLGGAGLGAGVAGGSLAGLLTGAVLVALGALSPWAVLHLLPHFDAAASGLGSVPTQAQARLTRGSRPAAPPMPSPAESSAGHEDRAGDSEHPARDAAQAVASSLSASAADERAGSPLPPAVPGPPSSPAAPGEATPVSAGVASGVAFTDGPSSEIPRTSDSGAGAAPPERLPGLGPRWQRPDMTWSTVVLGPEAFTDQGEWREEEPDAPSSPLPPGEPPDDAPDDPGVP